MAYPPTFDANGFTPSTQAEILAYFTGQFQTIYGADVNLTSASPDGQLLNILVQAVIDVQDLLQQINASFDPDQAVGNTLASRVTINGIQKKTGSQSTVGVTVTVSQALTLTGTDALIANPNATVFTIADGAGTQWQLLVTTAFAGPGAQTLTFQAVQPGAVTAQAATIVNPMTVVLGVTSVSNPLAVTTVNTGTTEEADGALRLRRQQSVAIGSQGVFASLLAALENINGLIYVALYENPGGATSDGTVVGIPPGIPSHSIWVIVAGSSTAPTQASIANAIYTKRNLGCGMFGATQAKVTQADGSTFYVYWDYVKPIPLYIKFNAHSINGVTAINVPYLQQQLALNYVPAIGATVDGTSFGTAVQAIDPNCLVTNVLFSIDGVNYFDPLADPAANEQFSIAAANIAITVV